MNGQRGYPWPSSLIAHPSGLGDRPELADYTTTCYRTRDGLALIRSRFTK